MRSCAIGNTTFLGAHDSFAFSGNPLALARTQEIDVEAQLNLGVRALQVQGVAFAQKYRGEKHCTFALYGDGASNQGQAFKAFNMAKLWNLPCVFVCENNKYGMGTSAARSSSNTEYFTRGDKIPGIQVNGMDIIAAKHAVEWARKWAVDD